MFNHVKTILGFVVNNAVGASMAGKKADDVIMQLEVWKS
jgi:hypothetical protein